MADHVSPEGRHRIMKAVKSKDTQPELFIRRLLHRKGYRYQLHRKDLPGKPDIVFYRRKKVIFIHGCFWHQHDSPTCPIAAKPSSNKAYWIPKLARNKERDAQALEMLHNSNWKTFILWECQIIDKAFLWNILKRFIGPSRFSRPPYKT